MLIHCTESILWRYCFRIPILDVVGRMSRAQIHLIQYLSTALSTWKLKMILVAYGTFETLNRQFALSLPIVWFKIIVSSRWDENSSLFKDWWEYLCRRHTGRILSSYLISVQICHHNSIIESSHIHLTIKIYPIADKSRGTKQAKTSARGSISNHRAF